MPLNSSLVSKSQRVRESERPKRILIFEVNWLGDVLFSTPAIRAIRKKYSDSHIAALVVPRCREVLEHNPDLNEIISYQEKGDHRSLWGKWRLVRDLRRRKFDLAFIFHRSFTRALMVYLAGIPDRVGYAAKGRGFLLTRPVAVPSGKLHKVEYFLQLVRQSGIDSCGKAYGFYVSDDDRAWVLNFFTEHNITPADFLVVLNPGGNWEPKRWPADRFAELANHLVDLHQARIIITGEHKDKVLAERIAQGMNSQPISLCGKTSLTQLFALFDRVNLVISGDSGPMHIASAGRARVIALFGPTSPEITGPSGKDGEFVLWKDVGCEVPCYDFSCSENRCLKAITVEDVLKVVKQSLVSQCS